MSMHITVSALGHVVKPSILLHAKPERYVDTTLFDEDVVCIHNNSGYMEKETFKYIMKNYLIKLTALVVDGHLSRYDAETFEILDDVGIDLIILPAHNLWTSLATVFLKEGFPQSSEKKKKSQDQTRR